MTVSKDDDNKFFRGKDGWLFLDHDSNRTIDQITGKFELREDFDERWRALLEYRRARFNALGIGYGMIVAPNKECVYSQHLPDTIALAPTRPIHRVLKQAKGLVDISYPIDELIAKSREADVYPTGDTHWSLLGALIPYREMASMLGFRAVTDDEIELYTDERGDLSAKAGEKTVYIRGRLKRPTFELISNNEVQLTGNKMVFRNTVRRLPSCVMFRDSFGTILLDVMAQSFSRFVAVWQPNIDYSIIESERPDIVINEHAERFLVGIPNDQAGKTNAEYVREKLAGAAK